MMSNKFRAGKSTIDEFKQVMGKHQNNRYPLLHLLLGLESCRK